MSAIGQSCAELCAEEGYACNTSSAVALQDPKVFDTLLSETLCVLPLISGCGGQSATYDPENQLCYYPEPNCTGEGRTKAVADCNIKVTGVARFCGCDTGIRVDKNDQNGDNELSAGTSIRCGSILLFAGMLFLNPKLAMVMLALFGLNSAHNWVNTPSRSTGASTEQPCKPPVTPMPHVAVGPGQRFQIEWMSAHGSFAYNTSL
jgi:hypothetical protein